MQDVTSDCDRAAGSHPPVIRVEVTQGDRLVALRGRRLTRQVRPEDHHSARGRGPAPAGLADPGGQSRLPRHARLCLSWPTSSRPPHPRYCGGTRWACGAAPTAPPRHARLHGRPRAGCQPARALYRRDKPQYGRHHQHFGCARDALAGRVGCRGGGPALHDAERAHHPAHRRPS